jgi:hypothetical protein
LCASSVFSCVRYFSGQPYNTVGMIFSPFLSVGVHALRKE